MKSAAETREAVKNFWNASPCDSDRSQRARNTPEYFLEIERDRYAYQWHIPVEVLSRIDWKGRKVLEIGTGVGTDAREIIRRGADYTGINIDQESVELTRMALTLFGLPGKVEQCDATAMPYPDNVFDVVYSYGAFPCIPDLERAIAEIYRVLKPGGEVIGLLYNKSSINYHVEIRVLRRVLRPLLLVPGVIPLLSALGLRRDRLEGHRRLYRERKHLSEQEWLSRNTDGPDNPYISIQDHHDAARLFQRFEIISNEVWFFDHRHWGILGKALPEAAVRWLGRRWGWHRVVHARKPPVPK